MIRILIVDDEPVIRKGIRTSIDWESRGFTIVGEADNGREGLAKALECRPHIVISDIRMPVMDGLQLAQELRLKLPDTRMVLLSGYDDFEYARTAIRVGVSEYLLKPVGGTELIGLMEKLKSSIVSDQEKVEAIASDSRMLHSNLPILQSRLLMELLKGGPALAETSLRSRAQKMRIDLSGPEFLAMVIGIDDLFQQNGYPTDRDRELLKYSIINVAGEVLGAVCPACVGYGENDQLVALLCTSPGCRARAVTACWKLLDAVRKYLGVTVTVGMGRPYSVLTDAARSYREAQEAIRAKVIKGKDTIIFPDEVAKSREIHPVIFSFEEEREILNCLSTMDENRLDPTINRLFDNMVRSHATYETVKALCVKLFYIVFQHLDSMGIDNEKVIGRSCRPYEEIEKYETIGDIKAWVKTILHTIIQGIEKKRDGKYRGIVRYALEYIRNHYSEDMNIADVARAVFVTPNYLSRVFKEEVGENYTDWLNRYRIDQAKILLRTDREAKAYEIAEKVGFNNYKYFIMVFKKYTSATPKEYRNNLI